MMTMMMIGVAKLVMAAPLAERLAEPTHAPPPSPYASVKGRGGSPRARQPFEDLQQFNNLQSSCFIY